MKRVMSLYLPNWPTDRLRKQTNGFLPDKPLITATQSGNRRLIAHADSLARKLGMRVGQTVAHAQAVVPGLQVAEAEEAADHAALLRLAQWCVRRYSPLVALDAPNGLWIDITGCDHRFGGEAGLQAELLSHCREAGFDAVAAIADTTGAAHAVARYASQPMIVPPRAQKEALAGLPIAALRLPLNITQALAQLGLDRIYQLYDMPRAPLSRRFGIALMRRFDQAIGHEDEPLSPIALPETPVAKRSFSEPASSHDYLRLAIDALCEALCKNVEEKAQGIRQVDLWAERVDGRRMALRVGTARPTHDAKHLAHMLGEKVPEIDIGFGIEHLSLVASLTEPSQNHQHAASFGAAPSADIEGLIDVIANRGAQHLYRLQSVESDVPERSVKAIAPLAPAVAAESWPQDRPRPGILFRRPENVDAIALLPDHAPVQFTWRRERYRIIRADGPERIHGEWWRSAAEVYAVRDYFRVEDEQGRRFWLFRRGNGTEPQSGSHEWFLHGIFG